MARRRRSRGEPTPSEPDAAPAPPEAATEAVEASADTDVNEAAEAEADVSPEPSETPDLAFDPALSQRILRACAGIHSFASSASDEASQAAAPFLSFAQRSRIRALATDFESRRQTFSIQSAPATAQASSQVVDGAALGREEVEAIVNHRIDIAVQEAFQTLGISPDATIPRQIERTIEVQLNSQEQRLLDYVKRHLTDSLEMLESTIEDRIADYIDAAAGEDSDPETEEARAEIDAKVEEAREQLLKNIDEVREVQVGFDIANFASQIIEINEAATGGHRSIGDDDIAAGDGEEIELGDGDEIELAGDDDIELTADDDVELAADDDVELAADDDIELAADDDIELAADDGAATEVELAPEPELAAAGDSDSVDIELAEDEDDGDGPLQSLADLEGLPDNAEDLTDDGMADVTQSGDAATLELDSEPPPSEAAASALESEASDEAIEEISVIAPIPDDLESVGEIELDTAELVESDDDAQLQAGMALDLGEDEDEDEDDDENLALSTLGTGPEDLQVAPIEDISDRDIESEIEIEIEIDEEPESEEARANTIERYLQRAAEMRNRRQAAAAMELYSKVLDLDDANYEARIGRGVLNLEAKDYKRAVDEFTRAEKIDASRPASALGLAEVHFHRKQFNKAIRHYTQCLKLDDKLAQAYCNRGLSYYYQKNYKKAFLDLMRAYDIDSELPNIKKYLKLVRNKVKSEKG